MKKTVDMTKGGIGSRIITFAIPIILTGVLQVLYNAADMIVIGRFSGKNSLAAVGSTAPAINLVINLFIGLSSAAGVIVAHKFGAKNESGVSTAVHTSVSVSIIGGLFLSILGITIARPLMRAMGSPDDVLDLSVTYLRIYFIGVLPMMIYNFGASIIRSVGDSKRPLIYLALSGSINVLLNMVFVVLLKWDVAGVAAATTIAQFISAVLVLNNLLTSNECYKLVLKKLRIYQNDLFDILYIGIPAGIQNSIFSLSNVIIQSSINSVGSVAMAGNAAAANIEGVVYTSMNAFHQSAVTFVSQNFGAMKFDRIKKGIISACVSVSITGLLVGGLICIFADKLLSIYATDLDVILCGRDRIMIICSTYFLCGLMDIGVAGLRGIGSSFLPMSVSILGIFGIRMAMIISCGPYTSFDSLKNLYISYPVAWTVTGVILFIVFAVLFSKKKKALQKI